MSAELLLPVLVPVFLAIVMLLVRKPAKWFREIIAVAGAFFFLLITIGLFRGGPASFNVPWLGYGMNFDFRLYHFSGFILTWVGVFIFLVTLFSTVKMAAHRQAGLFYCYVFLTAAFASGAVLSANFIPFLFFWESLLLTTYGFILLGNNENAHRTAVKSFILGGTGDFCLILGIGIIWYLTKTFNMAGPALKPEGLAAAAFYLMMIGATGKAGAVPLHTWIPDAGTDAPVSMMALIPASVEKLLGIYLLTRICLDFFKLRMDSPAAIVLMALGALTIVIAAFMTFVQKNFKRLLSYGAITQVGYMVLGIGTATPLGIAGGLFHMLNHAIYKSGLFLTSGSVEHKTGTTDLNKLGGLAKKMPVTALSFVIMGAAFAGIWPVSGFVSKEMIFHASLKTGMPVFTAAAYLGVIFTFAAILKAGHAMFLGRESEEIKARKVRESESPILIPMVVLAFLCLLFGLDSSLPLNLFIQPVIAAHFPAGVKGFLPGNALSLFNPFAGIAILCLAAAFFIHRHGWLKAGKNPAVASDEVRGLPVFRTVFGLAERRVFDIYEQGVVFLAALSRTLYLCFDRGVDGFFEKCVTASGKKIIRGLRNAQNGQYANYLAWLVAGLFLVGGIIRFLIK